MNAPTHPASLNDTIRPTTFIESPRLSDALGARIVLACETFQWTGSFKFRAAYNVAVSVPNAHIVTASSGNFGQALAYACRLLGKTCTIVMPDSSSQAKIEAVRAYGGVLDMIDTSRCPRAQRVAEIAAQRPDAYVASAYDDPLVIQGNATLGAEIARSRWDFDIVVVPIGGGGLASGVVTGLRTAGAAATVIGAEPLLGNDAARSLRAGHIIANEHEPQTMADGARTVALGRHNWDILRSGLADIVEVSEECIADAVRVLYSAANLKAEPTGALGLGAMLSDPKRFAGRRVCCIVSGGNVDRDLYASLIAS